MNNEEKLKKIIYCYNPPTFNWFYKWEPIQHKNVNLYGIGDEKPTDRISEVIWKSKKTGKIIKKEYNYQVI